jgi:hypothetical protein
MVLAVLSSRMSAGGCSLAGCRDNVPCLAITAILFHCLGEFFFVVGENAQLGIKFYVCFAYYAANK